MYGLTREMSSKLERCMVTRETYTPLELKTKPNQHLSSNKNPDHLNISRVIETKLNQHLSSDQIRQSTSRVIKMPDTLWTPRPYREVRKYCSFSWKYDLTFHSNQTKHLSSDQIRPSASRVMKSDQASLE